MREGKEDCAVVRGNDSEQVGSVLILCCWANLYVPAGTDSVLDFGVASGAGSRDLFSSSCARFHRFLFR